MFKKIEIWILYITILFSILFAIGFGALVRHEIYGGVGLKKIGLGWVSETALFMAEIPNKTKELLSYTNQLLVDDRFIGKEGFIGSVNSSEVYLLLARYDGNLKESVIELVDLQSFDVLHIWNPDIDAFNNLVQQVDEFKYLNRDANDSRARIKHPKLLRDGKLILSSSSRPITKIDACSSLVYQNARDIYHHSIETNVDGNIWASNYIYPPSLPIEQVGRARSISMLGEGFRDDGIVKLSPDGEVLFEKSVAQIFIDNNLEYLLFSVGDSAFTKDPIHLNDIQPVDFDGEYWKKGDVFLSLRKQSMVLLYRPSSNKIIWKGVGPFFHQHDVDIIDDHRISIFNNNSKDFINGDVVDGHNEVLIYNFKTDEYKSYLKKSFAGNDIRTITEGLHQILPNGDLFVEETNYGRTLYFNEDGSLRWFHVNRAGDGNVYRTNWSRILYTKEDIEIVNNFLNNKPACYE